MEYGARLMCVTCGCGQVKKDHNDPRNLTKKDFHNAGKAAEMDMHHVVANINQEYNQGNLGKGKPKKEEGKLAPVGIWENPDWGTEEPSHATRLQIVAKASTKRYTLGVAYMPDHPDVSIALDGHQDKISPEELEKTAWGFMSHPEVGLEHQHGTEGAGIVVESYIYRGPDWRISPDLVIKAGAWLVGVIWNPEAWKKVLSGEIKGFSPQGVAKRK
jgi:hypothetical protein